MIDLSNHKIVYIDSSCHYTEAGENILSDFIANSIFTTLTANENQLGDSKNE